MYSKESIEQNQNDKQIALWLKAEEELRKGNYDKCLELKDEFRERQAKLTEQQQQYIMDYLYSVGA